VKRIQVIIGMMIVSKFDFVNKDNPMDWFMPKAKAETVLPPPTPSQGESELEKYLERRKRLGSLILTGSQGVTDFGESADNRKMFGA
jgi:hypothetical protein